MQGGAVAVPRAKRYIDRGVDQQVIAVEERPLLFTARWTTSNKVTTYQAPRERRVWAMQGERVRRLHRLAEQVVLSDATYKPEQRRAAGVPKTTSR